MPFGDMYGRGRLVRRLEMVRDGSAVSRAVSRVVYGRWTGKMNQVGFIFLMGTRPGQPASQPTQPSPHQKNLKSDPDRIGMLYITTIELYHTLIPIIITK